MSSSDFDSPDVCDDSNAIKKLQDRAIMLLARREHSIKELVTKLEGKTDLPETTIYELVVSLSDKGYQSNTRFIDMYLRSQINKNCGPVKILHDLKQYGIDSREAVHALEAAEVDWAELAFKALNKKYAGTPLSQSVKVKAHRFLRGRGFEFSHIDYSFKLFLSSL